MAEDNAARSGEPTADPMVERFLEGDAEAIAEALRITRQAVHYRGFYVPGQDRGELVQETLLTLLRQLSDPARPRPRSFEAYVRTLAYRRCVDWMRRMPRERDPVPEELPDAEASAEASMLSEEKRSLGQRALAALDASCRDLILRYMDEDTTFRKIAEQDGRLEKTVRNQMYKCLDKARVLVRRMTRLDRLRHRAPGDSA